MLINQTVLTSMEKECLLSVIIPAFNAEKTIGRTLASICKQPSNEVEVIVIDDGSTDATVNEYHRAACKHTKLLTLEQNCGQGAARNLGIQNAKGKYISFVDADDWVSDDYIGTILSEIKIGPDVDLFLFGVRKIMSDSVQQIDCPHVEDILSAFVLDKISCAPWGKVYLREIINNHSIRFADIKPGEDIVFNAMFLRHIKKFKYIPGFYYNYDCRQPSTTRRPYSFEIIEAHRKANEILKQELSFLVDDFDNKYLARSFRYFFMHSMWRMANDKKDGRLNQSVKKNVENFLRSQFRLLEVLRSKYLSVQEKVVFVCFVIFRPLAYSAFEFQLR